MVLPIATSILCFASFAQKPLCHLFLLGMALPLEQTQRAVLPLILKGKKCQMHFLYTWPFFWFRWQIKNLLLTNV